RWPAGQRGALSRQPISMSEVIIVERIEWSARLKHVALKRIQSTCLSYDIFCRRGENVPLGESSSSLVSGEGWIVDALAM
ncbi:MAG: hypothetical protein ABJB10_12435, partial [Mesorhizobium sp.]